MQTEKSTSFLLESTTKQPPRFHISESRVQTLRHIKHYCHYYMPAPKCPREYSDLEELKLVLILMSAL